MGDSVTEAQVEAYRKELEKLWNRRAREIGGPVEFWDIAAERAGIPVWRIKALSTRPRSFLLDQRWVLERTPDRRGVQTRDWWAEEDELDWLWLAVIALCIGTVIVYSILGILNVFGR